MSGCSEYIKAAEDDCEGPREAPTAALESWGEQEFLCLQALAVC